MTARSRNYVFTLNNPTDEDQDVVYGLHTLDPHLVYAVVGMEVGDSGTPHFQGFLCFSQPKSLKQMREIFDRAHYEPKRGTFQQAADYCKKDGNWYEHGELPMDQDKRGAAGKEAFEEMMRETIELVREGNYKDINPQMTTHIKACEYRVLKEQQQARNLTTIDGDMPHEWYYGPAGTGKSRKAREENPQAYLKMCNKWWDGYAGEDVVLIEDFDATHACLGHHMKIWSDRYAYKCEVKNGTIDVRPKKIIVTSNYHPTDIWTDQKTLGPILRRFNITHFPSLDGVFPPPRVPGVPFIDPDDLPEGY